jgi:hypothetical protein
MQAQVQTQASDFKPVFYIHTSGSFRYSEVDIIYPEEISLRKVTSKQGEHVVDLGILKIRYKNYDSRKNLHRDIEVLEVRQPVVVKVHRMRGLGKPFDEVYILLPPNIVRKPAVEELKEELTVEENGKYRYKVLVRYVEVGGTRVVVEKTVMEKEPVPERLVIKARVSGNTIEVYGDTYHVREVLKELKFRWDPVKKIWYAKHSSEDDVNYTLFELEARLKEKGVSLVIEGVKSE